MKTMIKTIMPKFVIRIYRNTRNFFHTGVNSLRKKCLPTNE